MEGLALNISHASPEEGESPYVLPVENNAIWSLWR